MTAVYNHVEEGAAVTADAGHCHLSAQQIRQKQLSSSAVAELLHDPNPCQPRAQPSAAAPHKRVPAQKSHFASPTDFYTGPSQPGKIIRGVRRYKSHDQDYVGDLLTDESMMAKLPPKKFFYVPKDSLTNNCDVSAEEQPHRRLTRPSNVEQPTDAPYFEDNDPKPARDVEEPKGRRHYKNRTSETFNTSSEDDSSQRKASKRENKSNKSLDVLHLYKYNEGEINERPFLSRHCKINKFVAPDMPPARRPIIHRVKVAAKDEHDVLGTGRFGKPEKTHPCGVAKGANHPPKTATNIFAPPPPEPVKVACQSSNILKYYNPSTDTPLAQPKIRASAYNVNKESKDDTEVYAPKCCRAHGAYHAKISKRSCDLRWVEENENK